MDTLHYTPEDIEDDELVEDLEGLTILDDIEACDEEED
jgi:hypothetical protein